MQPVAYIGLGNMGQPMCRNLMRAGVTLYVFNRTEEKMLPLIQEGALRLKSLSQAFQKAPIVITMLANDAALVEVTEKLLETMQPGSIHISMSTVSPELAKKMVELHASKGAHYIAAPVFGRPEAAVQAKLWICMAGNAEAKKRAEVYLKLLGQRVEDFGEEPSIANVVKIAGNFMILSAVEAMGEGMRLAHANGVEKEKFANFFTETIFNAPVYKNYGKLLVASATTPVGFKLSLGFKDMNLMQDLAENTNIHMPFGTVLHKLLTQAVKEGKGDLDWLDVARHE